LATSDPDGTRGSVEFDLKFSRKALPGRGSMAELDRIREQNKQLEIRRLQMEIDAFRAEQKKQLEIEVEKRKDTLSP